MKNSNKADLTTEVVALLLFKNILVKTFSSERVEIPTLGHKWELLL